MRVRVERADHVGPDGWSYTPPDAEYGYGEGTARLILAGDTITVRLRPDVDESIARLLVLGPGIAGILSRTLPVVHGTTLRTPVGDVLVVGPSGMGKSTLAATWVARGASLVADDISALDGHCVRPGVPFLKLWEDTARAFGHDPASLDRIHPDHAKYRVRVPFAEGPRPLARVLLIERSERFERVSGSEALLHLLANHRLPEILTPEGNARWLDAMSGLVRRVPVFRVGLPGPLDALQAVVARVESVS
ncbi:MAG: hypothetical protein R3F61_22085 [Myxococcota bacterium]